MLQEFAGKVPDIIIALVAGMMTGLVCLLVDRSTKKEFREGSSSESPLRVTLTHIVHVSHRIVTRQSSPSGVDPGAMIFVLAASIAYLRYQDDVLVAAALAALFLLGIWFVVTAFSLLAGHLGGFRWPLYLILMVLVLTVGILSVIPVAMAPTMLPQSVPLPFDQWQRFALDYGVGRLLQLLGLVGAGWLLMHVLGVAAFFVGLKDAALSMVFYAAAGSGRLSHDSEPSWLTRFAARYAHPFRRLVSVTILMLAAYWFASGSAFFWLTQEMPSIVNEFMREIINGRWG